MMNPSAPEHQPDWSWHLIEHDLRHGGEISKMLGTNGMPALEL
jgi:hypothetical protein